MRMSGAIIITTASASCQPYPVSRFGSETLPRLGSVMASVNKQTSEAPTSRATRGRNNAARMTLTTITTAMMSDALMCARSRLTKKAEPPPTRDVNRDSGTDSANGGWLRRLVRRLVQCLNFLVVCLSTAIAFVIRLLKSHRSEVWIWAALNLNKSQGRL